MMRKMEAFLIFYGRGSMKMCGRANKIYFLKGYITPLIVSVYLIRFEIE